MIDWNEFFSDLFKCKLEFKDNMMKDDYYVFEKLKHNNSLFYDFENFINIMIEHNTFVAFERIYGYAFERICRDKTINGYIDKWYLSKLDIARRATILYLEWFFSENDTVLMDRL